MVKVEPRSGLRLRTISGVDPEVRRSCIEFAKWLRKNMDFPIRIVIYLKKDYQVKNLTTKELVSATFFAPNDKKVESYIKIATGDYQELLEELGTDNALASILNSIAHELIHYQQWLKDENFGEIKAVKKAEQLIDQYAETRDHP